MSWSSRQLETLVQRVEVLRLFATSKLWYKASALPLPVKLARQFESAMYRFLWIGKLEKLKLDEIKNPALSGGLNVKSPMQDAVCRKPALLVFCTLSRKQGWVTKTVPMAALARIFWQSCASYLVCNGWSSCPIQPVPLERKASHANV